MSWFEIKDAHGNRVGSYQFSGWKTISIGRTAGNDIQIENAGVSAMHASIVDRGEGKYYIRDEGSDNGTVVNGTRLQSIDGVLVSIEHALNDGDVIDFFGKTQIVFHVKGEIVPNPPDHRHGETHRHTVKV